MMKIDIPNWLIMLSGGGQIFTALVYPYIRHKVFDWYNDVKQLNQKVKDSQIDLIQLDK